MESSAQEKKSNAGNLYLIFLGLFLMALGGAFMFFMWMSFRKAGETRSWLEVPCSIEKSVRQEKVVPNRNVEYQWRGEYTYQVEGKSYASTRLETRGAKWTTKIDKVNALVEKFPQGSEAVCYVNPERHDYAILKHDSKGAGYSIWFPGLFAVGGLGMIFGAVKNWNKAVKEGDGKVDQKTADA